MPSSPEPAPGPLRTGYLGPAGTFSEEALLASAHASLIEPVALTGIYESVAALRAGEVALAIVPIENSLEGSINITLDLLAGEARDVRVVGEALLAVRHSLIAARAMEVGEIETVLTHPQVPGQCTELLRGPLARARVIAASSTAEAVRIATEADEGAVAAIGTSLAARIYGGVVLREGVQDRDDNETRFAWLAREDDAEQAPPLRSELLAGWRCALVFWGAGAQSAGWLVGCLDEFSSRDINLTKIESRPQRRGMGSYLFFAEIEAGEHEQPVPEALGALRERCEGVRVLGSYRSARAGTPRES